VQRTGRLVIADGDHHTCGTAAELSAMVTEDRATFEALKAPVVRVTAPDVPVPWSPSLLKLHVPTADSIKRGIEEVLSGSRVATA
jgi:pyruvate dehydrogenase E1 component beta subunit